MAVPPSPFPSTNAAAVRTVGGGAVLVMVSDAVSNADSQLPRVPVTVTSPAVPLVPVMTR